MLGTLLHHRFRLEQALHRGASGHLYLATDERTGEMLAVKVFPPHVDFAGEDGLRYVRALSRAATLSHPHLLLPRYTGEAEGLAFQVLPYFPADALTAVLADGPLPPDAVLRVLTQLAEGLAALHGAGLAHLNLKPSNVLVSRDADAVQAVLCDPLRGLLVPPDPDGRDAATAACLAPEQTPWLDADVDARADLFALGALGFLMATGQPPVTAPTAAEVWHAQLAGEPPHAGTVRPDLPPALADVLRRLLAPRPRHRYPDAAALLADLRAAPAQVPGASVPASPVAAGAPLAGRRAVQETVLGALARAATPNDGGGAAQGDLLWLSGAPGSGRGALVRELLPHLEAARALVLHAAVPPGAECPPFHLPASLLHALAMRWGWLPAPRRKALAARLADALGPQAAVATALVPALATLLPDATPPEPLPLGRERARVLHALCEAFVAAAEPGRPLVLWMEHVDTADADSLDWLAALARRVRGSPLLVLAGVAPDALTRRPALAPLLTAQGGVPCTVVELPPLQAAQVSAWLAEVLAPHPSPGAAEAPGGLPERLGRWLHERWGGLPLAHGLALRGLLARGLLHRPPGQDGPGPWRVDWDALERAAWPESLAALVQHRLELLPDETVPVLQAVAAAPEGLAFTSLCALVEHLPPPLVTDAVEQAVRERVLVRRGGRIAFRHALLREAVWRALPEPQRAALHGALAAELEANAESEPDGRPALERPHATAEHFRAAGDSGRCVANGLRLVAAAWERGALRAVCRWTEHLQPMLAGDPRLAELLVAGGVAHAQLGEAAEAVVRLDAARALGLPEETELEALTHAAWAEHSRGNRAGALRRVEEALALAGEALPAQGMGTALARLGGAALRRYETLRAAAEGTAARPLTGRERRVVILLALAAQVLGPEDAHRTLLADERILRIAGGHTPTPHLVGALVRLGEADGDPDASPFAQARTLLARHDFPHAHAMYDAAVGRCRLAAGRWLEAREALRAARDGFRRLGALTDEAGTLVWLIELLRLEGDAGRVAKAVAMLAELAPRVEDARYAPLAEGLRAYAAGCAGRIAPAPALEALRTAAEALHAAGDGSAARYLLALGGELALAAGDLGAYLATVRGDPDGDGADADYAGGLLLAVRAEGHLMQAALLPEEADHHLQLARTLLRDLRALHGLPLRADLARVHVMERFLTTADAEALALAEEALAELDGQGLLLPAAWLRFRVAEALKSAGDDGWLHWGGEALTAFDTLGATLHQAATRRLLELEPAAPDEHPDGPAPRHPAEAAGAPVTVASAGGADGALSALLRRLAHQGPLDEADLHAALLDVLSRAVDAETGVWLGPDGQGRPAVVGAHPAWDAASWLAGTWLAQTVWREARPERLEHFRPPASGDTPAGATPEAQSLLGVAVGPAGTVAGPEGAPRAAVVLAAPVSRTVFDATHLARLQPLVEEAEALLALNGRLLAGHGRADALARAAAERERLDAWAAGLAHADRPDDLLGTCLDAMARPTEGAEALDAAGGLLCLREGEELRLAAVRLPGVSAEALAGRFPLPLEPGRALAALRRRVPVPGAAADAPAPTEAEQALLHTLGTQGTLGDVWLPLVHGGAEFGVILLVGGESLRALPPEALELRLMAPLRRAVPALHAGWRAEAAREALARATERAGEAERQAALTRSLLPPDWPADAAALEAAFREGIGRTAPVLAGDARGLARPGPDGLRPWREALAAYYGQVRHGLALHEGLLLRVQHPHWFAAYPGAADSALWGAQTLHQILLGLEADGALAGGLSPATGLGLHLGPLRWEPLAGPDGAAPTLLGAGVRTAARLAAMSRSFRCGILVSRDTVDALAQPARFDLRALGRLRPEAGGASLEVFELFSVREAAVRGSMRSLQGLWDEALREFRRGRWSQAAAGFARYARELPQDRPARYFLRQSRQRAQG